ncbi:MAG TPA: photosystem II cytochrome PsbV2 [Candidatus Caenarcaniphilales bacterium]
MLQSLLVRCFWGLLAAWLGVMIAVPVQAATVDAYIVRYLKVSEPVPLEMDKDRTRLFSATDLTEGKHLFEENCKNCHVGGATLPNPLVSLSLEDLKAANPPRDTVNHLVAYLRKPMSYDGREETYWCREVPESWMSQAQVENLAAFVLRAAQKAPSWGTDRF